MIKYYILFVILSSLDLIGSYLLLSPEQEFNPICSFIWREFGFDYLVIMKTLLTFLPIIVISTYHKIEPKRAKAVIILANVIITVPVVMLLYIWSLVCQA